MAANPPKVIQGRTFDTEVDARAHAQLLGQQGMKVRLFGPARRARIQGAGSDAMQWPAGATADRYLVIGTDGTIETPPGSAD
jgi:hypothetical protein